MCLILMVRSGPEPSVIHEVSSDEYSDFEPLLSPDGSQLFIMMIDQVAKVVWICGSTVEQKTVGDRQ